MGVLLHIYWLGVAFCAGPLSCSSWLPPFVSRACHIAVLLLEEAEDPVHLLEEIEFDVAVDENSSSSRRGVNESLKHAEKARVIVKKIPGMIEALTSTITAWEKERERERGTPKSDAREMSWTRRNDGCSCLQTRKCFSGQNQVHHTVGGSLPELPWELQSNRKLSLCGFAS
ncbi:65-kDa microtubule-associated protein [Salix suchowensis]|nr:65-kDa microtubule-associated protein [Salix suchowensis]